MNNLNKTAGQTPYTQKYLEAQISRERSKENPDTNYIKHLKKLCYPYWINREMKLKTHHADRMLFTFN